MNYSKKNVLVLGLGISGRGVAEVLAQLGANVTINDLKAVADNDPLVQALKNKSIHVITGMQNESLLENIDLIVLSPGISPHIPLIEAARQKNIPFVSEVEIAFQLAKMPILGITGTNGKTTTTMLVGAILKTWGKKVVIGGNIGSALSQDALQENIDFLVAELSSYQLENIVDFKTYGSIILNITPDHLARHKTMAAYQKAKENIFKNQEKNGFTILNFDDEAVRAMQTRIGSEVLFFSRTHIPEEGAYCDGTALYIVEDSNLKPVIKVAEIKLKGWHNIENCLAAMALTYKVGCPLEVIHEAIKNFEPVEHRMEFVANIDGVEYYNDSKATNTDSTLKALEAFTHKPILILGGYDKNEELVEFMAFVKKNIKHLICMGAAGQRFFDVAKNEGIENIALVETLKDAVLLARKLSQDGDIILLSPACSSFDYYKSFEERGQHFKEIVEEIQKGAI